AGVNPDHLLPVDPEAIPKTSIGKIQHKVLSRRFREGAYDGVRRRVELLLGHRNTLPSWFFKRIWRPRRAQPRPLPVHAPGRLLFIDRRGLGERIIAARPEPPTVLVETGTAFADAGREPGGPRRYRVGPANPGDYERLIESLCETDYSCGEILHLWTYDSASPAEIDGPEDLEKARETGIHSLLFLFQALARSPLADADAIDLTVVSSRAQAVSP
ncbi:MAG: AMP-dependent synthetase, partial [bacterium]|nr:AMP-dependent synthetase [bacterium]